MVECLVIVLVVGECRGEARQQLLTLPQVVQFVLEDDAAMEQPVHQEAVAGCQLLFRERNLGKVVLTLVGVLSRRVRYSLLASLAVVGSSSIFTAGIGIIRFVIP